jgi:phosphatidylglycerol:prolipoprotein diacylglycerol transferase
MYPRLLELGPVTVYTYGVLLAAAYLLGLKLAMNRAKARGLDAKMIHPADLPVYRQLEAEAQRPTN